VLKSGGHKCGEGEDNRHNSIGALLPTIANLTAKQTSTLHKTPLKKALPKPNEHLSVAMEMAVAPTAPLSTR